MKRLAALALSALALVGCSNAEADAPAPDSFIASGTLELGTGDFRLSANALSDDQCSGADGYDDIAVGAPVKIYDASGSIVALGEIATAENVPDRDLTYVSTCVFRFDIPAVPSGEFFEVEVASRGKVPFTRADAEAGLITLTLG